jgi:hypothetical protein
MTSTPHFTAHCKRMVAPWLASSSVLASCTLDVSQVPVDRSTDMEVDMVSTPGDGGTQPVRELGLGEECPAGMSEYFANVIPVMTAVDKPSGQASSSSNYSAAYPEYAAFDGNALTLWISDPYDSPAWLSYMWSDAPRLISRYAIVFANGELRSRAPRDWTLEAYEDGAWIMLDQQGGETGWKRLERREYLIEKPAAYSSYRLHVTEDNDDDAGVVALSIGSFELQTRNCR